jgi:hypothetical protein
METRVESPTGRDRWGTLVLLTLIFVALLNIGNEIRYQGCISRQVQEVRLFVEGHDEVRPVQCHRLPF